MPGRGSDVRTVGSSDGWADDRLSHAVSVEREQQCHEERCQDGEAARRAAESVRHGKTVCGRASFR